MSLADELMLAATCAKCGARVGGDLAVDGDDLVEAAVDHFWEQHPGEHWELVTDANGAPVLTEVGS